ncbi:MAG: alanine racemase [Methylocystaceae bacterium]
MTYRKRSNLSWVEIDLAALHHNLEMVRGQLKNKTKIIAVVKADAYGHGAVEISRVLIEYGIDALAVATVGEALELRHNGIGVPILILGSVAESEFDYLFEQNLTPTLNSVEMTLALNNRACVRMQKLKVHLRIDIGMGSYGVTTGEGLYLIDEIMKMSNLELQGIYTHINTMYGGNLNDARGQVRVFNEFLIQLKQKGVYLPLIHASSSPAVIRLPDAEYDMVRLGIVLYGLPCGNEFIDDQIQAVMQIKTKVVAIKTVGIDSGLGYGWTFKTMYPSRIATVPLGYADASFLHHLKAGEVIIREQRAPIIGKPCMDHFLIDISSVEGAAVGDEVVILGKQGNQAIYAEEIACRSGIDPNNIDLVGLLGSRIPRVYRK